MKIRSRISFFVLVCLPLTIFACSPNLPTQNPAGNAPAQAPGTAPVDSDLSESEILQIVRASLAAYPWRLEQSVLVKETGQTLTSLTEVQSSTRGYSKSVQTLGTETVTIESILMDELVYLKMSGSPASTYGLPDGLWMELPPDSPLAQLVDRSALEPAGIAETFVADFAAVSGESGVDEMLFTVVGSEAVNGVPTNIYESKGATFTYRWWIGTDQRFYKTTLDKPEATRTILVEYDPGINIQPPIP